MLAVPPACTVDADNDYVTIVNQDFASSDSFSFSFWFTRQGQCNVDNRYEFLFSQSTNPRASVFDNAGISVLLGCQGQAYGANSGDTLLLAMVDDEGTRGRFQTVLPEAEDGGFVVNQWMHVVVSVSETAAKVYLDGALVGPSVAAPVTPNATVGGDTGGRRYRPWSFKDSVVAVRRWPAR